MAHFSRNSIIIMTIIIMIIAMIIVFILSLERFNKNVVCVEEGIKEIIRQMLKATDEILSNSKVEYWIDGGTLLGTIRHKDIIPWDDDADICILQADESKFLSLKNLFNDKGYDISEFWGGYKIFPLNGEDINFKNRNWQWNVEEIKNKETFYYKFPFIDVFLCAKFGDSYHFKDSNVRNLWPKYFHTEKDLFPLKEYQFNHFTLKGPNNPSPYLDRSYGSDWRTLGYRSYDHKNQKILPNTKFSI